MGPLLTPSASAQQLLSDPTVRAQVLQMHQQNVPFLDMADQLGIGGLFVGPLRDAIAGLTNDEVALIRKAFVDAIGRAGTTDGSCFPVACTLESVTGPVVVTELDKGGETWARVVAATK
jgi:hypothetical protein